MLKLLMTDLQYADYTKATRETYLFFGKPRYLHIISVFWKCSTLLIAWDILNVCKSLCSFFIHNFIIKKYEYDTNKI